MILPPPQIDALDWDEWNRAHIATHEVSLREVEDVIRGDAIFADSYKNRLRVTGPTSERRMLTIIIGQSPRRPNRYYVFSARPASRKERSDYQRAKGGAER